MQHANIAMISFARCILISNCLEKICIFFYFQYNVLSVIAFVFGPFRYILKIDCYELFPNGNWIVNGYKFYFPISYQWFSIDIWCFFHHNSCAFVRPNSCTKCFFVVKIQRIKSTIKNTKRPSTVRNYLLYK